VRALAGGGGERATPAEQEAGAPPEAAEAELPRARRARTTGRGARCCRRWSSSP
jgi:hypothetical protein